jgi:DNA invertase Pin-like site-specific DNA recombinase
MSYLTTHKIQPEHLARLVLIYVRQSSLAQVLNNIGSKARQYNLVQHALDLGWTEEQVVVVDQDQGLSGASSAERDGFQFLIAQVGLGRVGAVFSLEASRLSRACSDWHRLIEICALRRYRITPDLPLQRGQPDMITNNAYTAWQGFPVI